MPNHVTNTLTITGATTEQVQRIIKAAQEDRIGAEFMPMPNWASVPNEDGVLPGPQYFDRYTPWRMWQGGQLTARGHRFPNGEYDQRWYGWCVTNWGTKWGAYDCDASVNHDGGATIFYNTAWSPFDDGFFEAMSAQLPGAAIYNTFEEPGCDFYGVQVARDGECNSRTSDISSLKSEWVKANCTPEQISILDDIDHDDHDEVYDEVNDSWWDVSDELIETACAKMIDELEENFRPSSHKLKGSALVAQVKLVRTDLQDAGLTALAHACGYTNTDEFSAALFATHEGMKEHMLRHAIKH